jgi:hypothetical protein
MTPTLFLRNRLATYATQLKGLGEDHGSTQNFFFGPSIQDSEVLEKAIRNVASYPALMLEYPDNSIEDNNRTGIVEILPFGLAVIANHSARDQAANIDTLIYATCKPLLNQVLARLQRDSDAMLLKSDCDFTMQLTRSFSGGWIGPIANGAYGYRYTVEFRVFGSLAYDVNQWIL